MRRNPEMVTVTLTCYKVGWGLGRRRRDHKKKLEE